MRHSLTLLLSIILPVILQVVPYQHTLAGDVHLQGVYPVAVYTERARVYADAVCKVRCRNSAGTGTLFHVDSQYAYVLTNAHVMDFGEGSCEFYSGGRMRPGVRCTRVFRAMSPSVGRDIAVVRISVNAFAGNVPTPIPLAPPGYTHRQGDNVYSMGCPRGGWPTLWSGNVRRANKHLFSYWPPSQNGRSGSSVVDSQFRYIVGLIAWSDDSEGLAQTVYEIHSALRGDAFNQYLRPTKHTVWPIAYNEGYTNYANGVLPVRAAPMRVIPHAEPVTQTQAPDT